MTPQEARAAIYERFLEEWLDHSDSENVPVLYDNTKGDIPSDGSAFVRIAIRNSGGGQETHADTSGKPRFVRFGTVTVQVFTESGKGFVRSKHDSLCDIALRAFERRADGVWFRQQRINEIGPDARAPYFQSNVIAEWTVSHRRAA